jgi:hypothetical protein
MSTKDGTVSEGTIWRSDSTSFTQQWSISFTQWSPYFTQQWSESRLQELQII